MHIRYVFIVIPTLIPEVFYNTREMMVLFPMTIRTAHLPEDTARNADHEDGKNEFIFSS